MSLAEAVVGLVLGALVTAAGATSVVMAARHAAAVARQNELVSAARNALEWRLGVPCGRAWACPEPIDCSVSAETAGMPPGVVRLTARAVREEHGARDEAVFVTLGAIEGCP